MKAIKNASFYILLLLAVALLASSGYGIYKQGGDYFLYNFDKAINIIIALVFAFFFTQVLNDSRKQREAITRVIDKIIDSVSGKVFVNPCEHREILNMELRRIRNMIDLIGKHSKKHGFDESHSKLIKDFEELKEYIGEINWNEHNTQQTEREITRLKHLIENSCLTILLIISG